MAIINVVGSGVVGQATGKGFLGKGHQVRFIDVNPRIVEHLRAQGYVACYPHEVDWPLADMTMLAVNTPTVNGRIVLDHFLTALQTLARGLASSRDFHIVIVRSTVPPTTTMNVVRPLLEELSGRRVGDTLGLCMNPEFLRQVRAEEDFAKPWVTVVGSCGPVEQSIMDAFYQSFDAPIVHTDCTTAEVIKYANNLYNATKISFFNEMHLVSEYLGVDSETVGRTIARSAEGMWNPYYGTIGGWAYGGACLPKDTAAFYEFALSHGIDMPLLRATMQVNDILEARAPAPESLHEVLDLPVAVPGLQVETAVISGTLAVNADAADSVVLDAMILDPAGVEGVSRTSDGLMLDATPSYSADGYDDLLHINGNSNGNGNGHSSDSDIPSSRLSELSELSERSELSEHMTDATISDFVQPSEAAQSQSAAD